MIEGIIGKKLGMTQLYSDKGVLEPLTAIEVGNCAVTQVKTTERDGYNAVQLGFGVAKKLSSPEKGHLKGLDQFRYLRELRLDSAEGIKVGDKVDASVFKAGDLVDVIGTSRGKGFAGVVKRHHFRGGPKTHGQSDRTRHPGAIGSTTTPGRVWKGQRMAGHMGDDQVTVQNLVVFQTSVERNLLLVKGAVPGAKNGLVIIKKSGRSK
ncbi:MAG: 50S ribosomal protein L3 [Dehalococcoidales bacterium]|nr:50S ribosomal protein L3 [Dehalococcoidales bacterium]